MPFGLGLTRALAASAVSLALFPAAALAQGAGDDQYSDPFSGEESEQEAQPTPAPRAPAATPAPAQPSQTPAPGQPAPAATAAPPSGPTLPYTGFEDWLVAAGGAVLLGAGITLRVRLRDTD
jgi:hypothetical protein